MLQYILMQIIDVLLHIHWLMTMWVDLIHNLVVLFVYVCLYVSDLYVMCVYKYGVYNVRYVCM